MYDPRKDFSIAQTHSMIELNQTKANDLRLAYEDLTGPNAIFRVEVKDDNGVQYEWFIRLAKDTGDDNKWIPIKDSNCSEFQLGWLEGTPEYYNGCQVICKVSNTAGSVYSNYATLTITKPTSAPEITEQPKSQSVNVGSYDAYNKRRFAKYVIPVNGGSTGGTGEAGTTDYNELTHKPKINDVELIGNLSIEDLGITDAVNKYLQNIEIVVPKYQQAEGNGEAGQIEAKETTYLNFGDNTEKPGEITLKKNSITKISIEVLANTKDGSRVTDTMAEFIAVNVNDVITVSAVDIDCAHSIGTEIQLNIDTELEQGKLTVKVTPLVECSVHSFLKKIEVSELTINTSETI